MLLGIPKAQQHTARCVLQWLAFSARPMTLGEVAEALIVDTRQQKIAVGERRFDAHDVLKNCTSLVSLGQQIGSDSFFDIDFIKSKHKYFLLGLLSQRTDTMDNTAEIRLAHYSVKEYLTSKEMQNGPASTFAVVKTVAHEYMTEAYLIYLLSFHQEDALYEGIIRDFPFLSYAARHWHEHYTHVPEERGKVKLNLLQAFFNTQKGSAYVNWMRVGGILQFMEDQQENYRRHKSTAKGPKGEMVILQDVLSKIAYWSKKVVELGSMADGCESRRADVLWSGVLFVLQASNDHAEKHAFIFESMEVVARTLLVSRIQEKLYLASAHEGVKELEEAHLKLYVMILSLLAEAHGFHNQISSSTLHSSKLYSYC